MKRNDFFRCSQPHGRPASRCLLCRTFLGGQQTARSRIDKLLPAMRGRCGMQICARAVAGVDKAPLLERIEGSSISLIPIVLEERAAIPCQAEHLEVLLHRIDVFGLRALTVQILDAQNDFATLGLRDEPCRKCGIDVPRMHSPRGRRSKTPDHLLAHRITPFAPS